METRVLPTDEAGINEAARLLAQGDLVAFPTETVYGLGALASREDSIRAIFAAKGRPVTDPLILHLPEPDLARAVQEGWVASSLPASASCLAQAFWPGPLTLILPRGPKVHPGMTAGLETVAVRCPSHPAAQKLLRRVGTPLAAPSANRFGRISPTDAESVLQELGQRIPLILDGGPCSLGLESTVIHLTGAVPEILRPGAIRPEQISQTLQQAPRVRHRTAVDEKAQIAPGQLASHYAPLTPLYLCHNPIEIFLPDFFHLLFRPHPTTKSDKVLVLTGTGDQASAARDLYRALRRADASGAKAILADPFPDGPWAEAIRDRLHRASTGTAYRTNKGWELRPRPSA